MLNETAEWQCRCGQKHPQQRGVFYKDGTHWINYYLEGDQKREKVGGFQAAVDAYMARKVAIREGRFFPARPQETLTFRELLEEAQADRRHRLSPDSVIMDASRARTLLEWWADRPAAKITAPEIAARLRELVASGRSGSTVNRYKALASALFTWGVDNGKLRTNPARGVKAYRENEARVRFLSQDEEQALRAAIREDYPESEAEFDVALHTGLRKNELYRLRLEDVDLERGILTVNGKRHANSSASARRFLRLNSVAAAAVAELYERSNGRAHLCPGPRGGEHRGGPADRDYREWFEACVRKAGVENFRFHDLRHTFASRLVMAGVSLVAVAEMMGHRSLAMTMRYAHLAPDHQRANLERLVTEYPAAPQAAVLHYSHVKANIETPVKKQKALPPAEPVVMKRRKAAG